MRALTKGVCNTLGAWRAMLSYRCSLHTADMGHAGSMCGVQVLTKRRPAAGEEAASWLVCRHPQPPRVARSPGPWHLLHPSAASQRSRCDLWRFACITYPLEDMMGYTVEN